MKPQLSFPSILKEWMGIIMIAMIAFFGLITFPRWSPPAQQWVQAVISAQKRTAGAIEHGSAGHDHGDSEHNHGDHSHAHNESDSLELSRQAMENIGLTPEFLKPVQLEAFRRSITVPAMVVDRPGRTRIQVSTPMAGVITHVHAVRGEAVTPGTLLFEIRITAEELISTQTELLKTIGAIDIENREISRLEEVTKSGAVSQKTLLERQYAKDKLEVLQAALKEALRLQGLSERQINDIAVNRRLLRDLQILVPTPDVHHEDELQLTDATASSTQFAEESPPPVHRHGEESHPDDTILVLQDVLVSKGERVQAGTNLAALSDMSELYIEGQAFEQDLPSLVETTKQGWKVSGLFERSGQTIEEVPDLDLLFSSNDIDALSRTLRFYVRLPNQITRETPSENGQRYVEWKFRPGQRLQLRIPVEEWNEQFVLPVDAIAQEGAESFVFQQNGKHFDRIPVHVIYRDQLYAVIKNDGSIFPGDVLARTGAHQIQMALKNKSGGGADPHAGHTH